MLARLHQRQPQTQRLLLLERLPLASHWFLELSNGAVLPRYSTYILGVNTGFLVRF